MLIFIDNKAPEEAKLKLSKIGEVIGFETSNICYPAISGHPDIFFYQYPDGLIIAPNIPEKYKDILKQNKVDFIEGQYLVGKQYPQTAHYNALYTDDGILHHQKISDPIVRATHSKQIHCNQAYVRCNTIKLGNTFLTSDRGIERALMQISLKVCWVDPQGVVLQGFNHGFVAGCLGVWKKSLYICGSLKLMNKGDSLVHLIAEEGFELVELYEGPLLDVGGIFFIDC